MAHRGDAVWQGVLALRAVQSREGERVGAIETRPQLLLGLRLVWLPAEFEVTSTSQETHDVIDPSLSTVEIWHSSHLSQSLSLPNLLTSP